MNMLRNVAIALIFFLTGLTLGFILAILFILHNKF